MKRGVHPFFDPITPEFRSTHRLQSTNLVISLVREAVKMEQMVMPTKIHNTDQILEMTNFGDLSPYPTVVMETNAHQKASNRPWKNIRGNCKNKNGKNDKNK